MEGRYESLGEVIQYCVMVAEDVVGVERFFSINPQQINDVVDFGPFKGTILHVSCLFNRVSIVEYLLTREDIDISILFEVNKDMQPKKRDVVEWEK
eukprot:TRINITY_DN6745_c0_g1_i3.p1 TRINITY_DN6745_c0_g1~~TRINITY_DN6745_c0_g1_i3.p1  ORF type:complete len:106 (-),score=29.52 TRINITY_DN6745_c0_g1_i3:30-317(-)